MKIWLSPILAMVPALVLAAPHGGGHAEPAWDEHTQALVIQQAFNVIIIVIGLVYFLRQPVKQFFADFRNQYVKAAEKSMAAERIARENYENTKTELARLQADSDASIARARAEAEQLRQNLIQEGHNLSRKIRMEAETTARFELEKAKANLKAEMIRESTAKARAQLNEGVSEADHQRLNKEFIQNIETVNP